MTHPEMTRRTPLKGIALTAATASRLVAKAGDSATACLYRDYSGHVMTN